MRRYRKAFALLRAKRERLYRHPDIADWLINTVGNKLMHIIRDNSYEAAYTGMSADAGAAAEKVKLHDLLK